MTTDALGTPGGSAVRVFAAVVPSAAVRAHLVAALATLGASDGGSTLRWAPTLSWHLTTVFCAAAPLDGLDDLRAGLGLVAGRCPPVGLALAGAGRFGDRVLYARVDDPTSGLTSLAAGCVAAARAAGLAVDDRPYRPHLTLARGRPGARLAPLVDALAGCRGPQWTADELVLVRSRPGAGPAGGSEHVRLAAWPLTGRTLPGWTPGRDD